MLCIDCTELPERAATVLLQWLRDDPELSPAGLLDEARRTNDLVGLEIPLDDDDEALAARLTEPMLKTAVKLAIRWRDESDEVA